MPRFRNVRSGVEVSVSDEDAAMLRGGYEPVGDEKSEPKRAQATQPGKRAAKKSDSE